MVWKVGIADVSNECRNRRRTVADVGRRLGRSLGSRGLSTEQVSGMTNTRRTLALALAALLVCALAGCSDDPASTTTPTDSTSSSSPSPSSTSSDPPTDSEVAEQAATQLATDYFAAVDHVRQDVKEPLKQLMKVAIGGQLAAQELLTRNQHKVGNRQVGDTRVVDIVIQSVNLDNSDPTAGRVPTVQMDVCWDVSDVDVVNSQGKSIVSPDRADRGWTRFTVANHRWKAQPEDGWRISNGQDLKKAPCSAA